MRRTSQLGVVALAVLLVASAIGGGVVPVGAQQVGEETAEETETTAAENETITEGAETVTEVPETPDEGVETEAPEEVTETEAPEEVTETPEEATEAPEETTEAPAEGTETATPEEETETPEAATETPGAETETPDGEAEDGVTEIDSCTAITEPGRYVLSENLTDAEATDGEDVPAYVANASACIWIRSDDVTLDGNGYLVGGPDAAEQPADAPVNESDEVVQNDTTFSAGVAVVPTSEDQTLENVTVANLTATDWYGGVLIANATASTVAGVTASENAFAGVTMYDVADSTVVNTTASDNGFGGIVHDGLFIENENNAFANNVVRNNSVVGIDLIATDGNLLTRNVVADNEVAGVALIRSNGDRFVSNRIVDTGGNESLYAVTGGLLLFNSDDLIAVNTTATDNRRWTIYAENGSTFTASDVTVGARTLSIQGSDVALGTAEAFAGPDGEDAANLTAVGDGLVATNTSADNSSLLLGVRWTGVEEPTEPATPGPVTETPAPETETPTETPEVETEIETPEVETVTPEVETVTPDVETPEVGTDTDEETAGTATPDSETETETAQP